MPKGHSGIKRNNGKAKNERTMTPEEVLQSNIKETEEIAARGFMPEGAIYYGGTSEQRTAYYEAVDRTYKKLPEGYGYSFQERSLLSGGKEKFIQIEFVKKSQEYDYRTGEMKTVRVKSMMMGANGRAYIGVEGRPDAIVTQLSSRSALRGYAKAQVYAAAGKVYDPATRGASEKYPALDHYGEPKK